MIKIFYSLALLLFLTSCQAQEKTKTTECGSKEVAPDSVNIVNQSNYTQAAFPGGKLELDKYIANYIKKSSYKLLDSHNSSIYMTLTISAEGMVTNYKIVRANYCEGCKEIAIDLVKQMPKWMPAHTISKENTKEYKESEVDIEVKF